MKFYFWQLDSCNFRRLGQLGLQVEAPLLEAHRFPSTLPGSDYRVVGLCCLKQVGFEAGGNPTWCGLNCFSDIGSFQLGVILLVGTQHLPWIWLELQANLSFQVGVILLLETWFAFAISTELEAVGFDCPKQAGFPSRGNATWEAQVAHRPCQAVTTGLSWAGWVPSRRQSYLVWP